MSRILRGKALGDPKAMSGPSGRFMFLLMAAQLIMGEYSLDLNSADSVKSVASDMAVDMMSFYNGHQPGKTPGLLPQPYYWWEGGALMGALIDYWYYTGDTRWNDIAQQGLLFQVGPNNDYMPPNQTMTEGNDDQGFWGMAVLSAAEYNFPNPAPDKPQWLALAQAVFNTQAARWESDTCGGGLRWQIFRWNNGYNYKNSISQACFFNLAARLALYTGNTTYADWANRVWDWMIKIEFMTSDAYYIYDGAHIEDNCTTRTPYQWTYNAGAFLHGAAAMYNFTADGDSNTNQLWRERVDGLLNGTHVFFIGQDKNIMSEVACESVHLCDLDQQSFKAYLSRWMAATTKWAPWTYVTIKPLLDSSAMAATQQCVGGDNGRMCGLMWADNSGQWDGTTGVGQQMAAMEVVLGTLIQKLEAPVTNSTGGTSIGDPEAGTEDMGRKAGYSSLDMMRPITKSDVAGAYILTILALGSLMGGLWFVFHDEVASLSLIKRWRHFKDEFRAGGPMTPRTSRLSHRDSKGMAASEDLSDDFERLSRVLTRLDGHASSAMMCSSGNPDSPPRSPASVCRSHQERPSMAISKVEDYPNEHPWRRAVREGDFAGAIDPHRRNGAGFSIIDGPAGAQTAQPSSTSGAGSSSFTPNRVRNLTKINPKLEKKPLPGKPGLGRRQSEGMGDRKV